MNPALAPSSHRSERPSLLTFNKSTVMIWAAISLLLIETFSGALRYYFDLAGVAPLLYLPKVLCIALFGLELVTIRFPRIVWVVLLGLILSTSLGLLHGAHLENAAFSLFVYIPLLFGLVCGEHLEQHPRLLGWTIGLCLVASILGVYLDSLSTLPWKGYSYNIGDQELTGNKTWAADGFDRPAGFARMSTTVAMLIAIFTLYFCAFVRSRWLLLLLMGLAYTTIVLTTNKSTAAAFIATALLMPVFQKPAACRILFSALVAIGVILPMMGILAPLDPGLASSGNEGSLSSFYDRLINTWPDLAEEIRSRGWGWTGGGFGMVGSAIGLFPVDGSNYPAVADNLAMYLWAMLGLAGPVLYLLLVPLLTTLRDKNSRMSRAMLNMAICIVIVSWTTDVVELSICDLFLGMAISHALRRHPVPAQGLINERRVTQRNDLPPLLH